MINSGKITVLIISYLVVTVIFVASETISNNLYKFVKFLGYSD